MSDTEELRKRRLKFLELPFPKNYELKWVADVSLVSVSASALGCISAVLYGPEDYNPFDELRRHLRDLDKVIPQIPLPERDYFTHLRELAAAVASLDRTHA